MIRLRRAPVAVLATLVLLTACGGDDDDATPTTTEAPAGEETPTTDGVPDDDGAGEATTTEDLLEAVEATRASDTANAQLRLGFDGGELLGSQVVTLGGPVALDGTAGEIVVSVDGEADSIRIVFADGQAYVGGQGADVRSALPEGIEWVQVPVDELLATDSFSNPGDLAFLYLVGGAQEIEVDGSTYTFGVDMEAAIESAPEELRDEVASSLTFSGSAEPEITGEAEVDDEGRLVSLSVVGVQRPTAEEAQQLGIEETAELRVELDADITEIDEPIDVDAPTGPTAPLSEAPGIAQILGISPS